MMRAAARRNESSRYSLSVALSGKPLAPELPRQGWLKLSPINRRRLDNFARNRRGFWSFWIFSVLFVLSLFAEFIANDRPIVAHYKGETLWPIFIDYPEEKFGGFLAQTAYRDPVIAEEIENVGGHINAYTPESFSLTLATSGLDVLDLRCFDHSVAVHAFHTSTLKGYLKRALRSTLLSVSENLAPKVFTYHCGALCTPPKRDVEGTIRHD